MAGKVHVFQEVGKHIIKGDCWLVISGKVYDVTPFLEEHPGGDDVLVMAAGKDATSDFEDVGHSLDAQEKMKEFYIGDIDESTLPSNKPTSAPRAPETMATRDGGDSSKILLYILPLLILGVAFFLRFYTNNKEE